MSLVGVAIKALAVSIAAPALLLAAACGGDNGGDSRQTPSSSESASATPEGRTPVPTVGTGASTLEQLAAKYLAGIEGAKIKYDYVSNFGQHPDGEWTVYRLEGNDRQDWFASPEQIPNTTVTIVTPGQDYVCTESQFFGTCANATEEETISLRFFFLAIDEIPQALVAGLEAEVTELPGETYAGRTGQCYQIEIPGRVGAGPAGTESVTLCFSDEGELLYQKRIVNFTDTSFPQAELNLEALEFGAAVPADFEPPFEPS